MIENFDIKNKIISSKVHDYPFKHIVIEDFLPNSLYLQTEKMFSDKFLLSKLNSKKENSSNQALSLSLLESDVFKYGNENYSETFQMLDFFYSDELNSTLYALFGDYLIDIYRKGTKSKNLSQDFCSYVKTSKLTEINSNKSLENDSDLSLYTAISFAINTPSYGLPSSVRDIHIDSPNKLFNCLFYLRRPDDDYAGGDLILYRFKNNKIILNNNVYASHEDCISSKVIPYKANTLFLFINSLTSLHGVIERSNVPLERRYINISGSFKNNQFEVNKYQTNKKKFFQSFKNKIRNSLKSN